MEEIHSFLIDDNKSYLMHRSKIIDICFTIYTFVVKMKVINLLLLNSIDIQQINLDIFDVLSFSALFQFKIQITLLQHPIMGNEHICRNCKEEDYDHSILPSSIQARAIVNILPIHKQPLVNKNLDLVTLYQHQKQKETQLQSIDFKINSTNEENSIDVPENIRLFTGKGRVQYQPGWIYQGDLVLGVREGYGRMTWTNGDYYEGIFQHGRANGHGLFQLSNGIKYEGQFSNDEIRLGKRISAEDRQIYEGAFKNRQLDGYGILKVKDEFEYKGLFRRNQMEGSGHIKYNDGSAYIGEFRQGKKHGYGLWVSCNGSRYEGYWTEGERDGVGTFITKDGERKQKRFERGRELEL